MKKQQKNLIRTHQYFILKIKILALREILQQKNLQKIIWFLLIVMLIPKKGG